MTRLKNSIKKTGQKRIESFFKKLAIPSSGAKIESK